jgi:hypothetical protein
MTGIQAINALPELLKQLNALRAHLSDEVEEVQDQWAALVNICGGRDDHAVALLARVRQHLTTLEVFAAGCGRKLDATIADPFGRKEARQ